MTVQVVTHSAGGVTLEQLNNATMDLLGAERAGIAHSINTSFVFFAAVFVFSMQLGFTLLELGCVHMKNSSSILFTNLMDACIAGVSFYLTGYAFAYGQGGGGFIGLSDFAVTGFGEGFDYAFWFLQFAFAAATASIVAGAIAERTQVIAYFVFAFSLILFVYPVAVHWVWSGTGWASYGLDIQDRLFGVGAIDFAGCTVVHSLGGITALVALIFLGPRKGRFDSEGQVLPLPQQSVTLQTAGTLLLWVGWYGFNVGSTLSIMDGSALVAGKVALNMTISAAAAGATTTLLSKIFHGSLDVPMVNNGVLAGLVSITACCGIVQPYIALVVGVVGGALYFGSSKLLLKMQIDDVVDAVPVHLACGIWGTLAVGLFAYPEDMALFFNNGACGLLYSNQCGGMGLNLFAAEILLILTVNVWGGAWALVVFGALKVLNLLRVDSEAERIGLDITYHGGPAYQTMPPEDPLAQYHKANTSLEISNEP